MTQKLLKERYHSVENILSYFLLSCGACTCTLIAYSVDPKIRLLWKQEVHHSLINLI
jgi:hypothetical protein